VTGRAQLRWACHSCEVMDSSPGPAQPGQHAQDALLNLLLPFWQIASGLCVLAAVVVAGFRLARRGRSRITTALLLTGGAVLAVCLLGAVLDSL
jgi:hypothetical protein